MTTEEMIKKYFTREVSYKLLSGNLERLNEIRIRKDKPLILKFPEKEEITDIVFSASDITSLGAKMAEYSAYAFNEEIRKGYITLKGGFRVGLCGRLVVENEKVMTMRDFTSMNIRIPHDVKGCGNSLMGLYKDGFKNTLIVSPPGCGKTTLLRDLIRLLSGRGYNIGVCDERGELGCFGGSWLRADIVEGCAKAVGAEILIRALSPDIIAMDELGGKTDIRAIEDASCRGVGIIATVHGENISDIDFGGIFPCIVVLENIKGRGLIKKIYA